MSNIPPHQNNLSSHSLRILDTKGQDRNRNISPVIDCIQDYGPAFIKTSKKAAEPAALENELPTPINAVIKTKISDESISNKAAANDSGKSRTIGLGKDMNSIITIVFMALLLTGAAYSTYFLLSSQA